MCIYACVLVYTAHSARKLINGFGVVFFLMPNVAMVTAVKLLYERRLVMCRLQKRTSEDEMSVEIR